ncbi:leukocyte elastase inhibitor-like [Thamnophis elegans]|uniref:leukocyte elastase inhibitor-like n=1 Tax=Thamnophis elegans TaxID=35005 RepID=UPI00137767E7|nr:leukocyte elastase inhibitor-like [Thamnophis elegans]
MEALTAANTSFAVDFFKHLCKAQTDTNVLFSPWSISSIMATLYLGAKGHTAQQIAKVFHFNKTVGTETAYPLRHPRVYSKMEELLKNPCISLTKPSPEIHSNIHSRFQALNQEINKPTKNALLSSVNQLYGDKSVSFQRDFSESMKKYYKVEPQRVNFQETTDNARKEINAWIEQQTAGKILNLLNEGSINPLTRLILVNVLYFKGNWLNTFKKEDTTEQPFRLNKSTSRPIQMMFQHDKFNWKYIDELQTQILELQYIGNDFSMFILLPDDINDDSTGLEMLENKLTYEAVSKWTSPNGMEEVEANVHLPKTQLNIHYELKSLLTNMGITDAFNAETADFTGMSAESHLGVSQIFHKCFVDINEEGTEAAASAAGTIDGRSDQGAILFAADHPFLFFIRHNKTKNILFWGRFCSP